MSVLVFCLSALRAIVEMLGLALLAQGALALLAGSARNTYCAFGHVRAIARPRPDNP